MHHINAVKGFAALVEPSYVKAAWCIATSRLLLFVMVKYYCVAPPLKATLQSVLTTKTNSPAVLNEQIHRWQ